MKISEPKSGPPPKHFRTHHKQRSELGDAIQELSVGEWTEIALEVGDKMQRVHSYMANWNRRAGGKRFETRRTGPKTAAVIRTK